MTLHNQPIQQQQDTEEEEYYVIPIFDQPIHTPEHPFCSDMTCPCHSNQEAIEELNNFHQDGLVSATDADNIYRGKTLR